MCGCVLHCVLCKILVTGRCHCVCALGCALGCAARGAPGCVLSQWSDAPGLCTGMCSGMCVWSGGLGPPGCVLWAVLRIAPASVSVPGCVRLGCVSASGHCGASGQVHFVFEVPNNGSIVRSTTCVTVYQCAPGDVHPLAARPGSGLAA
jgi:hypothetical protein